MKLKFLPQVLWAVTSIFFTSCKSNDGDHPLPGRADFSRYIAVGNSLTAGQADRGQYLEGQQNSYPEIMAKQLKAVGGGDFSSAFFTTGQENGTGYLALAGIGADSIPDIVEVNTRLAVRGQYTLPDGSKINLLTKYQGPLNNYGVSGIRLSDVNDIDYGNKNQLYERLLSENPPLNKKPYLDFITEKPFTFFSCWLGNNDVLLYAARGGTKADFPTDKGKFTELYNTVVTRLTATGAKGVVATIPDVTKTAFLTTFTVASLLKEVQKSAPAVKDLFIQTADLSVRAATAEDFFILPFGTAGLLGVKNPAGQPYGLDPANPISAEFVLDKAEIAIVKEHTDAYNAAIRSVAAARNLALYDAFADFNDIADADGLTENGVKFTSAFIRGNLFSLDGIHLTPRGYAHVANGMIKVINEKYAAKIPLTDVSKFRAIKTVN
jgi:hypothetical protein